MAVACHRAGIDLRSCQTVTANRQGNTLFIHLPCSCRLAVRYVAPGAYVATVLPRKSDDAQAPAGPNATSRRPAPTTAPPETSAKTAVAASPAPCGTWQTTRKRRRANERPPKENGIISASTSGPTHNVHQRSRQSEHDARHAAEWSRGAYRDAIA